MSVFPSICLSTCRTRESRLMFQNVEMCIERCSWFLEAKVHNTEFRGLPPNIGIKERHPLSTRRIWSDNRPYLEIGARYGCNLVLFTNRKLRTDFKLVPKSVTLNDLEWRNGRYFALSCRIRHFGSQLLQSGLIELRPTLSATKT